MSRQRPPGKPPGDYTVGYGRPPSGSRYKPGQSGNPRGRPKAHKSATQMLLDVLAGTIPVTENGRRRRMTMLEVIFERFTREAAQGSHNAVRALVQLTRVLPSLLVAEADVRGVPIDHGAEVRRRIEEMSARMEEDKAMRDAAARPHADPEAPGENEDEAEPG